jgi:GH24 family phage-related lysozyme (muramidase)
MIDCGRCGIPNPKTNKFCGNCGDALDRHLDPVLQSNIDKKIDAALANKLTDQRIVEIDVQEKVIKRLTDLAKIAGIPIALLLAVLGAWGIKSLSDVDTKIKNATDEALGRMNAKVNTETERAITNLNQKVDEEDAQIVKQAQQNARTSLEAAVDSAKKEIETQAQGSRKRFDDLIASQIKQQSAELNAAVKAQGAKLDKLENTVHQLTVGETMGLQYEGMRLQAYPDQSGIWTIGAGHTLTPEELASGKLLINGKSINFRTDFTTELAEQLFQQDLNSVGERVDKLVTVKLTTNQREALVDFAYHMGLPVLANSIMLKELNTGNYNAVPTEMMKYTKIGNIESAGLKRRRQSEIALWRTP